MSCFELRNATASYDGKPVLKHIDLDVETGECVALMGRSGAGKSTLLGLLYDTRPEDIALVPQAAALVHTLSVFHNVYMGRLDRHSTVQNLRTLLWPAQAQYDEIETILADLELADKLREQAGALSGGQQQRVSVARAVYNGRPILLADEPVSALDRVQGAAVLKLLKKRHETLVLAMHDVTLALEYADRVVVLEDGRKVLDAASSSLTVTDLLEHFAGEPA